MNYALILAGGVGQRMRTSGIPKQFIKVFSKPIIIYTLEKFEQCEDIDSIVIACNPSWCDEMRKLIDMYNIKKVKAVTYGGKDRQQSVSNGINEIKKSGGKPDDIVVIHDGVRPLIEPAIISENIRVARQSGGACTVKPVIESVVVTDNDDASFSDFKRRENTYTLTSPQTFSLATVSECYNKIKDIENTSHLLDAVLIYTFLGNDIKLVKESNVNIKITTPEDYYILKALLELEENKFIFGI